MFVVAQHNQGVKTGRSISLKKMALDVSYTTIPKLFQYEGENTKPRGFKVAALVISAIIGLSHKSFAFFVCFTLRFIFSIVLVYYADKLYIILKLRRCSLFLLLNLFYTSTQ